MPLIRRKIEQKIPHNHAIQYHHITKYVHPTRLKVGDEPIPTQDISDRQLADLAYQYPDEYLAPCRERGVAVAQPVEQEDETLPDFDESKPLPPVVRREPRVVADRAVNEEFDDTDEGDAGEEIEREPAPSASIPLDEAQETFLSLNARTAIACIEQNRDRPAFLGKCYQAEKARIGGSRKTVLSAFTAAGVGAEE